MVMRMSTEKLYREMLLQETESLARQLYEREHDDLESWDRQPDTLRDMYRTRVRVVPLFAS